MIVIEGPDYVGKTTLAKELVKILSKDGPYVHRHLSKLPDSFDEFWGYLPMFDRWTVMDRFYRSRVAYAAVFQNQRTIPDEHLGLLDARLAWHGGVSVLVTATEAYMESRRAEYEATDQMYAWDGAVRVNAEFRKQLHAFDFHLTIDVDCTRGDKWSKLAGGRGVVRWPSDYAHHIATAHLRKQAAITDLFRRRFQDDTFNLESLP